MIIDRDLVARLEASAARVSMSTVEAFGDRRPGDVARGATCGRGALVAFGPGRYVNRAVGITLDDMDDATLDELERFFAAAAVPPALEVATWCPSDLLERLVRRGYVVSWFRNVYALPLADVASPHPHVGVREVTDDELPTWLDLLARGNELTTPEARVVSDQFALAVHAVEGATDFVAYLDDVPQGCGSLVRDDGLGWLGGAATAPGGRRHGVQTSLLRHRMAVAARDGCDLVAATAVPSGDSARNLSRLGFTLVYAQVVMTQR